MRRNDAALAATGLAACSLLLVGVDAVLVWSNGSLSARAAERQAFIGQTPQLARAVGVVAATLAASAAGDPALKDVLARAGVTGGPAAR